MLTAPISIRYKCAVCGKRFDANSTRKTKSWISRSHLDWPSVRLGLPICDDCVLSRFPEAAIDKKPKSTPNLIRKFSEK